MNDAERAEKLDPAQEVAGDFGVKADISVPAVRRIPFPVAAWRLWQAKRAYERGAEGRQVGERQ